MHAEDVEIERAGQVGHDGVSHRLDGGGNVDDGRVGRGDDQQVDARRRVRQIVPPAQRRLDSPPGGGEGTTQRESGPARADDA